MKLFTCSNCGEILYIENSWCAHCGYSTGFYAENNNLYALSAIDNDHFQQGGTHYQYCFNHRFDVCNWLLPKGSQHIFCPACDLNRTIPNLQDYQYREYWKNIEAAKHRLVYSLMRLRLPLLTKKQDSENGLCFDFIADEKYKKVFTGHDNGLITINVAEADDIKREMERKNMHEAYRTVLGHFRHEVGHYYWSRLVEPNLDILAGFRQLFGDYTRNYSDALAQYYTGGTAVDRAGNSISVYASSHPWEDWAETWAHYMHIMDTLETAFYFGLSIQPIPAQTPTMMAHINHDPFEEQDFKKIVDAWLPLTYAMNSLNRSMGVNDIYPFVITLPVMQKLSFIHSVCQQVKKGIVKTTP